MIIIVIIYVQFEETHGNEDTFRDMLRVQRSVETVYSQVNYLAAEMMAGESIRSALDKDKEGIEALAEMAELDAKVRAKQPPLSALGAENVGHKRKFVAASSSSMGGPQNKMGRGGGEEINIDEEDVEGEENEEPAPISQKPVPLAVFGSAAAAAAAEG